MELPLIGKVKRTSAPWAIGLVAAGVVGVSGAAVLVTRHAAPKQDISALTVPAQSQTVTLRITASGEVIPVRSLNLNPKNAGRLAELRVEQGDRVQQGQIVAVMDNRDLQADRAQAQAELAQAKANLSLLQAGSRPEAIGQAQAGARQAQAGVAAAQARLDLANQRAQRNQALAAEGAISRDRLDEVLNEQRSASDNLAQARASYNNALQQLKQQENGPRSQEIEQAAAQVASAQAKLDKIQTQLDDTYIRAPFTGIITQRNATEGDFVTPTSFASSTSSATSIVSLANDLEVKAKVPEVDIEQIKLGQTVEIRPDATPDKVYKGVVRLIAPEAVKDQNVTSFEVRVKLVTGKDDLRSGMNADLTFLGQQLQQALIVPTVAIVTDKGQTGVLVPDANNKPKFQSVTIGPNIGNKTQILSGLQAGDPVFVSLPEGQKLGDITKGINKQQ